MSNSDTVTKQDVVDLQKDFRQQGVNLRSDMRQGFDDILRQLDIMVTRIDDRFTKVEERLDKQEVDIKQILIRLDHIDKTLEISEQERLVMGHQLERLDKWVHDLAKHIDYKLPA